MHNSVFVPVHAGRQLFITCAEISSVLPRPSVLPDARVGARVEPSQDFGGAAIRPLLLVVPEEGAAPDTLPADIAAALEAEIAAGALSKWALPERIDIVADLARTSVGKIDKKRLRAMVTPG